MLKHFPFNEEPEVTPEWGNQYVNTEILLSRRGKMARGHVVCFICRSNQNLILDTCLYEVAFPGEKITELAANIIAESMYAQCDVNGNEYLLLETFIDHGKTTSALSVEDQKIVINGQENLRKSTAGWDICC